VGQDAVSNSRPIANIAVGGNRKKAMRYILSILTLLYFGHICLGQDDLKDTESFTNLTDTLLKREIAMFNFKGTSLTTSNSVIQSTLTEIPLRYCDNKSVGLSKGSTFVNLYLKRDASNFEQGTTTSLDSIFLVTHSHSWVRIPKAAFQGISNLVSCNARQVGKANSLISPFFKSFQSRDKRRIYIYIIGGFDKGRYEVTWIINDDMFYGRTIDRI
jgi:hypothetical protein